jgi:hypothetical protein
MLWAQAPRIDHRVDFDLVFALSLSRPPTTNVEPRSAGSAGNDIHGGVGTARMTGLRRARIPVPPHDPTLRKAAAGAEVESGNYLQLTKGLIRWNRAD